MVQGESERSLLQNSEAPTGVGSHGGRPTVGAMSPSMHVGSARAYFAVYHRFPLRENLREKAKCTLGPNSLLREKKSVHLAPTLPFGKKKLYTRPQLSPSGGKKSVHLAPTLLRERRGDLTVRGGLRAGSQRLIQKGNPFGTGRTKVYTWPQLSSGRVGVT